MPAQIAVIGGGPAGLRAAEVAATAGAKVTLYDAKRSVGRKFLVAGKSGLNLTNAEEFEAFLARYHGPDLDFNWLRDLLTSFDSAALRTWAAGLGVETFAASGGKVFPSSMKAAPLLRAWIKRLKTHGGQFAMNHRFTNLQADPLSLSFATPSGTVVEKPDAVVLALGGGSWPETGSTGAWTRIFEELGIAIDPLHSANCGWEVNWPPSLVEAAEGQPLKNIAISAGGQSQNGELVVTRYGLEGAPLYHLGPILREMEHPQITLDLKPTFSKNEIHDRLRAVSSNYVREARRRLKLSAAGAALLRHLPHLGPWSSPETLAQAIKECPLPLIQARPLAEAISSAGGVRWSELDSSLMLRKLPGVFVAGEMIDWEAPTGGYLIQGCMATGGHAGTAAELWARRAR